MDDGKNMVARIGGTSKTFVLEFLDCKHDTNIA